MGKLAKGLSFLKNDKKIEVRILNTDRGANYIKFK